MSINGNTSYYKQIKLKNRYRAVWICCTQSNTALKSSLTHSGDAIKHIKSLQISKGEGCGESLRALREYINDTQ